VPLSFNLAEGEVRHLTRAANKQPRDYIAWLIPVTGSWTELLVLHGSWPNSAIQSLLDTVDSVMPALSIILERFLGLSRRERLEAQLAAIEGCVDALSQSASVIGTANAMSNLRSLPADQVGLLHDLAQTASTSLAEAKAGRDLLESHLSLQEYVRRLEHAVQMERRNATTDPVTGLLNGRGALEMLQSSFEKSAVEGSDVSILLGDIDGFKLFNDTYGHVTGDQVLRLVADIFRKSCEHTGTISRYGGDEFLVILPGIDKESATELAGELGNHFGRAEFRSASGALIPISISIGVATHPEDSNSISSLIAIADSAMYAAKKELKQGNVSIVSSIPDTHFGVLEGLVMAVHAKDRYTKDHCDIVAEYAVKIAERLGLPEESKRALSIAGLLHDIGKLVIPDEILKKPSRLTAEEYEIIKQHVRIGEALIREVPQLKEVIQAVSCHHERFDGKGYPRGLKGEDIPLLGRIIGVADAYSAMRLDRPYRKAMSADRVLQVLLDGAGTQFDPGIVSTFAELMLEENVQTESVVA
jgi:diguanylate cyclase (GGDEF)-like protein/putative nucleotidyltransferase with HDIG domain